MPADKKMLSLTTCQH